MSDIFVLGQQCGDGTDCDPLSSADGSGGRLAGLMGLDLYEFLKLDRENLWPHRSRLTKDEGEARLEVLSPRLRGRTVVVLGTLARRCVVRAASPLTAWAVERYDARFVAAFAPHTSGRCRFYNSAENRAAAAAFLAAVLRLNPRAVLAAYRGDAEVAL